MLMKKTVFLAALLLGILPGVASDYSLPQLMAYRSFLPELEETARFAEMGIRTRTIFIANTISANGRPYCQYAPVWKGFGDYDYAPVDAQLGDILKVSPEADFIIMLDLNTPQWLTRNLAHDSYEELTHVAVMERWRTEARRYLDGLVRYVEAHYGDRVRAYVLMCGRTSEWFEIGSRQSREKNAAWRDWCAKRGFDYGLSTPCEDDLARGAFEGTIYDPATEKRKIDYWKFHNGIISDAVLDFAHVAKVASNGKPISADYGYYMICNQNLALSGAMDYERVIASPDIDFLTSPATYSGREIGGGVGSMLVMGSARRYGKRCLYSIDAWPHSKERPKSSVTCVAPPKYYKTIDDTLAGNTRSAAFALVHHANFHWFDQWGGFYRDPGMHERIAKIGEIQRRFADDASAPLADVMIVADPESAYERVDPDVTLKEGCAVAPEGFIPFLGCGEHFRNSVNRLGVVYDICSLNDLPHLDLSRIKAFLLADTWQITPEKERILRDCVLRDGRTAIWVYAPGVSDGKSVDAARVKAWAGVPFKAKGVSSTRMDGGWTAVYAYDYRELDSARLRKALLDAGCHAWTDDPTPVMANERLLAVHVKEGGRRTIRLPRTCAKVVDLLSGETVAVDAASFDCEFASPDTRIFEMVAQACTYRVEMPRTDGLYAAGDRVPLTVTAVGTNGVKVASGRVSWTLDNFGTRKFSEGTVDLGKGNPFTVLATRPDPGIVRLSLKADGSRDFIWSIAFDPGKIRTGSARPADFDDFWAAAKAKYDREIPVDVRLEKLAKYSNASQDAYRISLTTPHGKTIDGLLTEPADLSKGPFPVRIGVPGAGPSTGCPADSNGKIRLRMNVHYYPLVVGEHKHSEGNADLLAREKAETEDCRARYRVNRYPYAGVAVSREEYHYYDCILAISRALDWLWARPEAKKDDFRYAGTSQGGGFGLILAGFNAHITRTVAYVPAMTDTLGYLADGGRQSGWPRLVECHPEDLKAAAAKNAPYFDAAHFAARIRTPIRVAVGLADTVCAPCAVWAGYNAIPSADKAIVPVPGMSHTVDRRIYRELDSWLEM